MAFGFQVNFGSNGAVALTPANRALMEMVLALDKGAAASKRFDLEWGNVVHSIAGFRLDGGKLVFNVAEGIEAITSAARAAVGAVASLGKAIVETAAETQDLNLAIRLNVGAEKAGAIDELADRFAGSTRFDDDVFKKALLPLLEQGVTDTNILGDLTAAAVDIATRRGTGEAGIGAALGAFQRIAFKGEVDARALRELAVSEADFFANLGDLLGISSATASDLVKQGKVSRETLLSVALDEVAKREGGALGNAGIEGAKTLGATLERLSNLPGNIFKKLADSEGMARLQGVLDSIVDRLGGAQGDQIVAGLATALETMTSPAVVSGVTAIMDGIGGAIGFLADNPGIIEAAAVGFLGLGAAAAIVGGAFAAVTAALLGIGWGLGWLVDNAFVRPIAAMLEIGGSLVDGIIEGITGGLGRLQEAISGVGDQAVGWLKDKLGIASPSRVFAELGANTGEGFAIGLEGMSDRIALATQSAMSGPLAVEPALPDPTAAGGAPAGLSLSIGELHVHVGDRKDAREAGREAAGGLVERLAELVDGARLAWGGGVS